MTYKQRIEASVIIGFLYGIQSDFLPKEEVEHRIAAFKNTQGFKEAVTQLLALMDEFGDETYKKGYIDAGIAALQTNDKGE